MDAGDLPATNSSGGDAFAFLLDDIDHEDLARSLMLECAPPASAIAAALAGPPAAPPVAADAAAAPPPPPSTSVPLNGLGLSDLSGLLGGGGLLGAAGGLAGLLGGGGGGLGGLGGLGALLGGGGLGGLIGLLSGGGGLGGVLDALGGPTSVQQLLENPLVAPHQELVMRLVGGVGGVAGADLLLQQFGPQATAAAAGEEDDEDAGGDTDVLSPPSADLLTMFATTDESTTEDEKAAAGAAASPWARAQPQSEDDASRAEQEKAAPRKPPMENSTRKRQKEELAYLRLKVHELETELSAMKDRVRANAFERPPAKRLQTAQGVAGGGGASSSPLVSGDENENENENEDENKNEDGDEERKPRSAALVPAASKVSLWERVAKRQLIEKQKAEMKNQKLKEALEYQLKVAKSLEKVLKKRPGATLSTQVLDSVQVVDSKRFCSLSRSEASIYDMLIANTEKVYAELDDMCARNEFMQVEEDVNDMKLSVDASNQLFMEVTHAKLIPFDMQTTIDGVWRCLSLAQVPIADGGLYEAVERTHDTICAKSTMSIRVRNVEAVVYTRFVMKRYEEKDRTILVCESSTHSEGPREIVNGLKCLEKGWVVIKEAANKSKDGTPSTLIQLCMRMTPTISAGDLLDTQRRHTTGAVTDIILGTFNKSLVLLYQTVENIIMETLAPAAAAAATAAAAS